MANLPYIKPYDPNFLGDGFEVPHPAPRCKGVLYEGGKIFDYIHFSLVAHEDRQSTLYTAHNIDGSQRKKASRTDWDLDPRVGSAQTGPEAYSNNPWDRGHLVRRVAVAWGTSEEAQDASDATFYYTNAALQHSKFNQDEWLHLEDWVLRHATQISPRLCVFTGPIYTKKDRKERDYRIPSAFWKIIVLRDPKTKGQQLGALGFVMKQNEMWNDWDGADTINLQLYQVSLKQIGLYTGLDFGALSNLDEFEWRKASLIDPAAMKPIPINGPEDIDFFGSDFRNAGVQLIEPDDKASSLVNEKKPLHADPC